jgi:hypothetical protein
MSDRPFDPSRYSRLEAAEIIRTVETLSARIGERFPEAGLRNVCRRLLEIARQASERSAAIDRPILWLRAATGLFVVAIVALIPLAFVQARPQVGPVRLVELVQVLESGINDVVLIGAAVLFLATMEARIKRRRALAAIHELRSLAHIIDMHQLTKDPERIVFGTRGTAASPKISLTPFELERYLDYCSEMLALIGKIAALYVQHFEDSLAVDAVNDVEQLTSGLSQKIWQKIVLLHTVCGPDLTGRVTPPQATTLGAGAGDGVGV